MDRTLFEKCASNLRDDEALDGLWLGAEAMVAPACWAGAAETRYAAATERDVDPSWCVV